MTSKYPRMDEPTEKQVKFATDISNILRVPLPENYTKEAYSEFIGTYRKKLYKIHACIKTRRTNYDHYKVDDYWNPENIYDASWFY